MFNKNKQNNNNFEYYENMQLNRIYYELEEINRKLRNLNNRLHRVEAFLGLSVDDNKQ
ncbi:MAG: hypothetical protein IJY14_04680 [Acholeplasmatales bacterium]|nr:hypothetical protein [Acholeplasmatales bacterium]